MCEECYSNNNRIAPLLNPLDCLENHTQYMCGTYGRCICIEHAQNRGLRVYLRKNTKIHGGIIEGAYYAWCQQCFSDADKIFVLSVPGYKYRYRIIRRFIRRKLVLEQGKKETLKSLLQLLKLADKYQQVNLVEIKKLLLPYSYKVIK